MAQATLSVCLITKNEESTLKRCIDSIKKVADEIIVVDTGSTDNTVNIAKSLRAKVYNYTWNNNFADARNAALDKCTKDWIFVIDADEVLERGHDIHLKNLIQNSKFEALYLKLVNMVETVAINENPILRLFRNRKEYRYIFKFHEEIYSSINKVAGESSFSNSFLILKHFGYDAKKINIKEKVQRNVSTLKRFKENEQDSIYYFGLGNEYIRMNDMRNGKKFLLTSLSLPDKNLGLRPNAAILSLQACHVLGEYVTALRYANEFLKEFPDFRDIYFLKGACNYKMGRYSDSYVALNVFKALDTNFDKYPSFNFDKTNYIQDIFDTIKQRRILHAPNLLTTVITIKNSDSNFIELIKNVNEISESVLVINKTSNLSLNKICYELGAKVLKIDDTYKDQFNNIIKKKSYGKWILFLEDDIIFSHQNATEVVDLLSNDDVYSIVSKYTIINNDIY